MNEHLPHDFVKTKEELRRIFPPPHDISIRKQLSKLDKHCCRFIRSSPFVVLASFGAGGSADVSPRGDASGFVQILDPHTLIIPERIGNNRLDTLTNLLENPSIGLLFLVPGINETLRVNGKASIVRDESILKLTAVNDRQPAVALMVHVEEVFIHCGKALLRSHLWDASNHVDLKQFPTLGQMITEQVDTTMTSVEADEIYQEHYKKHLY
jgi:uncharacterized protein